MDPTYTVSLGERLSVGLRAIHKGLGAQDLRPVLEQYVADRPVSVVKSSCSDPGCVARDGPNLVEPPGVPPGMVFAAFTRASWGAPQLVWAHLLGSYGAIFLGLNPAPPVTKSPSEPCLSNLEPVAIPEGYSE